MRYYLLKFVLIINLLSCSVDDLPGCEGNGNPDEICKEYQYLDGDYNGLNNYFYDESGSVLISKITLSSSGGEEGSVFYNYDSVNRLSNVEYVDGLSKVVRVVSYKYNYNGSLIEETNSIDFDRKTNYNYVNGFLKSINYFENGILVSVDSLEYFTNSKDLYRTLKYIKGSIYSVVYNEWFGSDVLKESTFDAIGTKTSSLVSRYNSAGLLINKISYTSGGSVKVKEFYIYSENNLMEISKEDGQGNVFEKLVYQRFR